MGISILLGHRHAQRLGLRGVLPSFQLSVFTWSSLVSVPRQQTASQLWHLDLWYPRVCKQLNMWLLRLQQLHLPLVLVESRLRRVMALPMSIWQPRMSCGWTLQLTQAMAGEFICPCPSVSANFWIPVELCHHVDNPCFILPYLHQAELVYASPILRDGAPGLVCVIFGTTAFHRTWKATGVLKMQSWVLRMASFQKLFTDHDLVGLHEVHGLVRAIGSL